MQTQRFRDEPIAPMATGLYECTYIEKYRNLPTMEYCDMNHSELKMHKMRPRTPPMPMPQSRRSRSRSRSRSPRRRHRSPLPHYHDYRSRDRHIEPFDDRSSATSRARPQESRCIGVFGLSGRTTETDIRRIFTKYGYIENIILIMDNKTRRSRGYCFVYFDSLKSAQRAVDASVNLRIDSRYVRVDYSLTNRPRSPGSYERYKEELRSYSDSSRYRSTNRRGHSLSPRRYHR